MTERDYNNCVSAHADGVYRFILKNLQHEEDARDVVQSAFTVAYNQMIDHIRKNKRIVLKDEFSEETKIDQGEIPSFKKELEKALQQLTPLQKSLILLKDYEGYSYEEIGKITALNASQVKVYLHRARIQLKEIVGKLENII
ncbi:MAG: hypothetical protein RLZZ390_1359 [Bacteroidota bacterium]